MTRIALLQLCSTANVVENMEAARRWVLDAADAGAEVILLPESFAYIGPARGRLAIAESLEGRGPILSLCRKLARTTRTHLVMGSFPEACEAGRSWNTLVHLDPDGVIQARYRKIHLSSLALADGTEVQEYASTQAGERPVTTELPCGRAGLSIGHDLRYPGLYQGLVEAGAELLLAPSTFRETTGAAHWHLLVRARAVECQAWMLAPAQVGPHGPDHVSFGHSLAVDPWGEVRLDMRDRLGVGIVEVDREAVTRVRRDLPSLRHRREVDTMRLLR
ncbi:MAG: nitrilase-related carbon-nitrogen hydrolase [Pseudomonadales bacterium]|jgi:predicted amidohydrolase|nr:nitrilase-related carbon-nitrogen hydrolase [Pseudomonadales bacterium]